MPLLWAASFRHLLRHPAQLALAIAGLALGVGTIVAVDIATASAQRAFVLSMEAVNGAATHRIVGGPQGIDERLYVELRHDAAKLSGEPRIAFAPVVEGYVTVRDRSLQLVGIDPLASAEFAGGNRTVREELGDIPEDASESWFIQRGTVILTRATAAELGLQAGDVFELEVGGRVHAAELLGAVERRQPGYDGMILTDIAQAQEWLGLVGRLSRIDVRAPEGAAGDLAIGRLRERLPPGVLLQEAELRARQSLDMTAAFRTNLQAMSLLALLVGAFLIYSSISFAVVQRRRTMATLRALGATRSDVLAIVLGEAAMLGILGAGVGVLAGLLIGHELIVLVSRTINDLYFVVTVSETTLPPGTMAKALIAGVGTAQLAAALPAAEVAGSAPQLGMRRSVLEHRATNVSHWLLAASVLLAVAAAGVVALSGRSLLAGFVALFLLLLSVAALTPAVLRALAQLAARVAGRFSAVARLAFGDTAASLSRTGVSVAALGLAVCAMIGVSVMVESFRESLREWLERTMRADIYVTAPGPGFGRPERRLDPAVIEALLATEGIVDHSESRRVVVESPRGPIPVDALSLARESHAGIQLVAGEPNDVWRAYAEGAIVVSEPLAWHLQLDVGDTLTLMTAEGPRSFEVAGIYREYGNDQGNVLMDLAVYRRFWRDEDITALGLYLAPDTRPQSVVRALHAAAAGRQALSIRSSGEIRSLSMQIFERTFTITRVLYWLTAGVAALGLVSALLAWELERSRELATLRSLGMTPRATAALVEAQTGFMGLVALLAAIPAGVLTAMLLIDVINRRAFGWQIDLHLSAAQFGNALALALTAALAAGIYPAWRSARASVASELREE